MNYLYFSDFAVIFTAKVVIMTCRVGLVWRGDKWKTADLKGPYNANSTFIVLLYVHMRSWHVSQPTNA